MLRWSLGGVLAIVLFSVAGPAKAQTLNATNGHYYQYVSASPLTWIQARDLAAARTHNGWQGHLATITSSQENEFLRTLNGSRGWIGGLRTSGATSDWHWLTGESFVYTNWAPGEPNNSSQVVSNETKTVFNWSSSGAGNWNDLNEANTGESGSAYFVEFEAPVDGVPEPGSLALFLPALFLIALTGQRRFQRGRRLN